MLVIFDIDGTLCQTSRVDDTCWCRAAREILDIESMTTDWGAYPHSTDEAIACALILEHHGVEASRELLDRLQDRFVALVEAVRDADSAEFSETSGASALIRHLLDKGHHVAIATGGWRRSALVKMTSAGIPHDGLGAAFADDAHAREEIIRTAMTRAAELAELPLESMGPCFYVGDGLWDLRASRVLGIGFLGVATGERAAALLEAGAPRVLPDFSDLEQVMDAFGVS
ncbi:MAG: haloacid dehalogenase-like hydrolase [Phycisphaerales bacterium]|nr:haloacid dehalogenase-like hydrolase [Phycisphaerales bacterium]